MKTKPANAISCSTCRDSQYVLSNRKGKVQAKACKCFDCETCQGTGRILQEDAEGISRIRECKCAEFNNRLKLFNQAGIPGKFVHEGLDNYEVTPSPLRHRSLKDALSRSRTFIKEFVQMKGQYSQGLIFMGDPGLGKTHLAVSIIKELILKHGYECKFVDFFELLRDIRHGYGEDISEGEFINPYVGVKVLVIDELAKGRNTDWELTVLDHFISTRYNDDDKVTLVTTNFKDKLDNGIGQEDNKKAGLSNASNRYTLEEKIGPRIFSRLMEMCKKVHLQGKDFRQI
ncbi:MAG: ATP-binding protein [Nitrospinae bacterium]|nr:ATP-binding protein [Nitrospinota bacterium]